MFFGVPVSDFLSGSISSVQLDTAGVQPGQKQTVCFLNGGEREMLMQGAGTQLEEPRMNSCQQLWNTTRLCLVGSGVRELHPIRTHPDSHIGLLLIQVTCRF